MKKVISLLTVIVLFATLLVPVAYADGPEITVSSATAKRGESVTIEIAISGNVESGLGTGKITVGYPSDVLTLTGLSNVKFQGETNVETGMANHTGANPVVGDGVLVTATFTVSETAAGGSYTVTATPSGFRDNDGNKLTVNSGTGTITVNVPHTHTIVPVDGVDATCTTDGVKAHYKCSGCEKLFLDKDGTIEVTLTDLTIGALTHKYVGVETKDPSCFEPGEMVYTCSRCGDSYTDTIKATGNHVYGDPVKVEGNMTQHKLLCKTSGCEEEKYEDHTWELKTTVDPDCQNDGYKLYTCKCGAEKTETIPSTGEHVYSNWVDNKDGTHTGTCTGCQQATYTEDHTWDEYEVITPATCKAEGLGRYTCKCGATKDVTISKSTEHTYGKWVKVDEDTHKRECSVCGDTQTADHTWNTGMVTKPATCSEKGVKTFTCKDCGATKTEEIPATGDHKYTAKYEEIDEKTHKAYCACGESITEEHAYTQEGDILTKPTTTKEGQQEMLCVCGAKTTVTLKKVPADYDDVPKTGDITGQIVLFTVSAVAVIAGAAYIVIKRKLVK